MRAAITFEECMDEIDIPAGFVSEKESTKAALMLFNDLVDALPDWAISNKTVMVQYLRSMIEFPGNAGKIIVEAATSLWNIDKLRSGK